MSDQKVKKNYQAEVDVKLVQFSSEKNPKLDW